MRIDTDVEKNTVEIDDIEYEIVPRTIDVLERLNEVGKAAQGKPGYKLLMGELEVLLGKPAVAELFHSGRNENIDRLESIYSGVAAAFNRHANRLEAENTSAKLEATAAALGPVNELLRQVRALDKQEGMEQKNIKTIHRA